MIKNWMKKKVRDAGYKSALDDIERYLLALKGLDDREVAQLLAVATFMRLKFIELGKLSDEILNFEVPEAVHAQAQYMIGTATRDFQSRNDKACAGGTMVWLHSLRAQGYPELRLKGREMWAELQRGFEYAQEELIEMQKCSPEDFPACALSEYTFIPAGLEPRT